MTARVSRRAPARGHALLQALLLVALGALLAAGADVVLPNGVLRDPQATLRDLEVLMPVRLWDPPGAAAAAQRGEVVLVDGRSRVEFQVGHAPGALNLPADEVDDPPVGMLERLAGARLIIILGAEHHEDARYVAQDLAASVGAAGTGTLRGGFEAWMEAGLSVERGALP